VFWVHFRDVEWDVDRISTICFVITVNGGALCHEATACLTAQSTRQKKYISFKVCHTRGQSARTKLSYMPRQCTKSGSKAKRNGTPRPKELTLNPRKFTKHTKQHGHTIDGLGSGESKLLLNFLSPELEMCAFDVGAFHFVLCVLLRDGFRYNAA
jgi:hypothetical protein